MTDHITRIFAVGIAGTGGAPGALRPVGGAIRPTLGRAEWDPASAASRGTVQRLAARSFCRPTPELDGTLAAAPYLPASVQTRTASAAGRNRRGSPDRRR